MSWRETLRRTFPESVPFLWLLERSAGLLARAGFTRANTLCANVTCRDELMSPWVQRMAAIWGENFDLAGLGGFPSAGVTGFRACAAHVPDGGHLLVVYGAHVGISDAGSLGRVRRPGMAQETSACGAVLGLLARITADPGYAPVDDPLDVEQGALERDLVPLRGRILTAADPVAAITAAAYNVVDGRLLEIVAASGYAGNIALLGGITVHLPRPATDRFVPYRFEVRRAGTLVIDLRPELSP